MWSWMMYNLGLINDLFVHCLLPTTEMHVYTVGWQIRSSVTQVNDRRTWWVGGNEGDEVGTSAGMMRD